MQLQHWEQKLLDACRDAGVRVVDNRILPKGLRGAYLKRENIILLSSDLTYKDRVCTLMHEYHHYLRGDDGRQSEWVEKKINESIAATLICVEDYHKGEVLHGADLFGLADFLGVPIWVVEAYQHRLSRAWYSASA